MTKGHAPRTTLSEIPLDDNLFVDMKSNRYVQSPTSLPTGNLDVPAICPYAVSATDAVASSTIASPPDRGPQLSRGWPPCPYRTPMSHFKVRVPTH